jgi:hypothetical protein
MNNFEGEFSKHKVIFIVLGVAGVVLIMLMRGKGSVQSPQQQLLGAQLKQNELDAQSSVANNQANAQVSAQEMQAQATMQQYKSAEDAANTQTYAQLASDLANTQAQNHYVDVSGQVAQAQLGTQEHEFTTEYNTSLSALEDTNHTSEFIAQLEQQLAGQEVKARSSENDTILGMVGKAGLNHGTTSLEQNLTGILGEVLNEPEVAIAGENASANTQTANDAENASIVSSLTSGISKTLTSLFA